MHLIYNTVQYIHNSISPYINIQNQTPKDNTVESKNIVNQTAYSINHLPNEILLYLFSFLKMKDQASCRLVCKEWNLIADDPVLWELVANALGVKKKFSEQNYKDLIKKKLINDKFIQPASYNSMLKDKLPGNCYKKIQKMPILNNWQSKYENRFYYVSKISDIAVLNKFYKNIFFELKKEIIPFSAMKAKGSNGELVLIFKTKNEKSPVFILTLNTQFSPAESLKMIVKPDRQKSYSKIPVFRFQAIDENIEESIDLPRKVRKIWELQTSTGTVVATTIEIDKIWKKISNYIEYLFRG